MPRRPANLPKVTMQARFRDRLIEEMNHHGYTDASVAHRASEHYPVTANTVWKIRNSEPARRIDIDEGDAIARGCGFADLVSFLDLDRDRYFQALTAKAYVQTEPLGDLVEERMDGFEANLDNVLLVLREFANNSATRARLERSNTRQTHGESALDGMDPLFGVNWLLSRARSSIEARLDRAEAALADYRAQYLEIVEEVGVAKVVMPPLADMDGQQQAAIEEEDI